MDVVIDHNPVCGTSRTVLAKIRDAGIEPRIVASLKTPPTRALLRRLLDRVGLSVRDVLPRTGTPFVAPGLDEAAPTDDRHPDAIATHPVPLARPLVASPGRMLLCRPSERVRDLLPAVRAEFVGEDGERAVDAQGRRVAGSR
ncbi:MULTISPECIES: ArsC/Spx/MgsR family protein [Methylobacterium]|uniref:ArsC/Spx/MgsR family protein n=1 Tax=Methylobacterium TaxID=407 RepID=UPI0013EB779C|nr:ArsC/Spx/MgsR family protein [Methylobacterium sp. DB0501]NGM37651.1 arsenate reductase [Methylobacterium sp. DB0501]